MRRGAPIPARLIPPIGELGGVPREYAVPNQCIGHDVSQRIATRVCRTGDVSAKKLIVLMGDSHAWMWLPAVVEMARRDHSAVVPLLRLGCTPAKWAGPESDADCEAWYRWAVRQIGRLRPDITLVTGNISTRRNSFAQAGVDNLVSAARTLRAPGKVIVIGDPEGLEQSPVDCLLSRHASMATCSTTWPSETLEAGNEVARRAKRGGRRLPRHTAAALLSAHLSRRDRSHDRMGGQQPRQRHVLRLGRTRVPSGLPAGGGKRKPLTRQPARFDPATVAALVSVSTLDHASRVESRRLGALGGRGARRDHSARCVERTLALRQPEAPLRLSRQNAVACASVRECNPTVHPANEASP